MSPAELLQEITAGPMAASLAAAYAQGDDPTVADALNAATTPAVGSISRAVFAMWCGTTGLRADIQDAATTIGCPLRAIALTLLDFLQGGVSDVLHLSTPENTEMLNAWKSAGGITQPQQDALMNLASINISRAEQLGWGSVSVEDVARTRSL